MSLHTIPRLETIALTVRGLNARLWELSAKRERTPAETAELDAIEAANEAAYVAEYGEDA